jgi:hypothetical protein
VPCRLPWPVCPRLVVQRRDYGRALLRHPFLGSFTVFQGPLTDGVTPEDIRMAQWLTRGSMKAQRAGAAGKGRDGISGRDSARAASGHQGALVVGGGLEAGLRVGGGLPGAGCL